MFRGQERKLFGGSVSVLFELQNLKYLLAFIIYIKKKNGRDEEVFFFFHVARVFDASTTTFTRKEEISMEI